ncbi:hypothetical protein OKR31_14335 [Clostridioides difficile]|nr:hypothetical protein [Clostridioides difficile]
MLIQEKSFYPNNIYPKIDFLKIKRQLKLIYKNDLSDCGSINSIGEINIYYDSRYENKIQSIVGEIEQLFKYQVENFSVSKFKH